MDNEIKTWLYDIMQSINEVDSYYKTKPRIFEEYQTDIKTKRAIERNLEIIGEAVNRIRKKDKNFRLDNAEKIIATRNRIIHGYDNDEEKYTFIPDKRSAIRNLHLCKKPFLPYITFLKTLEWSPALIVRK